MITGILGTVASTLAFAVGKLFSRK
ncbi:hypothetical protein LCGC14_2880490, partial [marine sediment metagenome]